MTPTQFEQAVSIVRYHLHEVGKLEEEAVLLELLSMGLAPVSDDEILEVAEAALAQVEFFAEHGVLPMPDLNGPMMGRC